MKAVVYSQYGSVEQLHFEEVPFPVIKENEVLVKVIASSINSWDWDLLRGKPLLSRIGGLFKPQYQILGADIAGIVEAIGDKVTMWKIGDEVYGDISESGWGGFAEYTAVQEGALARKPENLSFEQTAAIPQAGLLAWLGLHHSGPVKPNQKILFNGAGGGVGTLGIQMAKYFGAFVTGVDKGDKLEMIKELGADKVMDYTLEDFTKGDIHYNLILDVVAYRRLSDYRRVLAENGRYIVIGGTTSAIFRILLGAPMLSIIEKIIGKYRGKEMQLLMHKPDPKILESMYDLFNSGQIRPIIDRVYNLGELAEAMNYFSQGNVQGKIVIRNN